MPTGPAAPVAVLVGCLVLAALLAAVETALGRITRSWGAELVEDSRPGAMALQRLLADPARSITVATMVRVLAEAVLVACAVVVAVLLGASWWGTLLTAVGAGFLLFVLVGVAPRTLARQYPDTVALRGAPFLVLLAVPLGGVVDLVVRLANSLVPGRGYPSGPFASEAELLELVEQAEANAVIEHSESLMLQRVVHLGDTVAREVMVPRPDMLAIDAGTDLEATLRLHLRSGFSRIPVVGKDSDDVRGLSYLKDVAARLQNARARGATTGGTVDDVMRPVAFVPESKAADDLLADMQAGSVHLAVVVDEYGGVAGLVTIEDLLEEIVGQISDEYDREAPEAEELEPGRWRVSARMHLLGLTEITGVVVEDDEVDTVAGLLAKELGRVPITGSTVEVGGLRLTADRRGRRNRLLSVLVEVLEPVEEHDAAETDDPDGRPAQESPRNRPEAVDRS